jgi:predicted DNA-binding transcriptional regulator AlpA
MQALPEIGFLRLKQIVGDRKAGIPPIVPVSPSTWWAGIKSGRFPKPTKIGPATTVWRAQDIHALIESAGRADL